MRVKWIKANIDNDILSNLKDKMLKYDYDDSQSDGFRLDKVNNTCLFGRYILKRNEITTAKDPFGQEYTYSTIEYDTYSFILRTLYPQLVLIDTPRAINPVLNKLAMLSGYKLAVSDIELNVEGWIGDLAQKYRKVTVLRLATKNIPLSNQVAGKVILSGTEDVRQYLKSLTVATNIVIDKVKLVLDDEQVQMEMTNNGTSIIKGMLPKDDLIEIVSNSFRFDSGNLL